MKNQWEGKTGGENGRGEFLTNSKTSIIMKRKRSPNDESNNKRKGNSNHQHTYKHTHVRHTT